MSHINVDVRSNLREVMAEFQTRREGLMEKAAVRALNRALDQTATEASREIRKVYNLKHGAILKAMEKKRANKINLFATLRMRGRRIGLIEFSARQTRAGATVMVKRAGARSAIPGSFITTLAGGAFAGYRGVFVREGKARYPIRALRGISIPQAFKNAAVLAAVKKVSNESFNKNFRQQLRYLNGKLVGQEL